MELAFALLASMIYFRSPCLKWSPCLCLFVCLVALIHSDTARPHGLKEMVVSNPILHHTKDQERVQHRHWRAMAYDPTPQINVAQSESNIHVLRAGRLWGSTSGRDGTRLKGRAIQTPPTFIPETSPGRM